MGRRSLGVAQPGWPAKRRELKHRLIDSTVWNDFKFRKGDIVIASWAKSGTTWMQQIVAQLVFDGAEGIAVSKISPWIELRLLPPQARAALDMQTHRRFVKTHLPVDALIFSRLAKFIYIDRDGRDAAWSLYNHFANYKPGRLDEINNAGGDGPLLEPTPSSVEDFYRRWFARDGYPLWPFWEQVRSWWSVRDLPNVLFIHFNDLKADLAGSIRRVAEFLEIAIDEENFRRIIEHCGFDYEIPCRTCDAAWRRSMDRRRQDLHQQRDQRPLARHPSSRGCGSL